MYENLSEPWIKIFTLISITTATWKS